LAAVLAIVAVLEYVRLVKLSRLDTAVLLALGVLYPLAAWLRPSLLGLAPIIVLACSLPSVLSGSPREIADTLRGYREKYGLTSFTFQENHVDTIAKVIPELR